MMPIVTDVTVISPTLSAASDSVVDDVDPTCVVGKLTWLGVIVKVEADEPLPPPSGGGGSVMISGGESGLMAAVADADFDVSATEVAVIRTVFGLGGLAGAV